MLFGAVSGSMAVSLGRSSGATLLGRPLDVSVQVEPDPGDASAPACVEADVFYGDERVAASRVQASVERTAAAQDARIRIRVARAVDEPVITLYVRAGCVQRTERRYVLLADVATEQAPAPRVAGTMSRPAAEVLAPAAGSAAAAPYRLPEVVREAPAASRGPVPAVQQAPRALRPAAPQPPAKASARLRLDPIDLRVDTFPQLRPSTQLLSLPAASPAQRTQAAALWKALSTQPEDVLEAAAKVSAIEADVRGLQMETRKNQAALAEFGAALQTARQERYDNGLVYGLLVALLFTLAGLAWFWRRPRLRNPIAGADGPWWRSRTPVDTGWHSGLGPVASGYTHDSQDLSRPAAFDKPARMPAVAGAPGLNPQRNARSPGVPLSRRDQTDFGLSMPHTPRAVKAEELFDVQHQAEFFISIGKEEQAISILLDHIGDDVQSSALIYLDLFGLYHKLGRSDDYQELAASFNATFNAHIPDFEAWTGAGRGLESHASTLAKILAAWPRTAVLALIESLIFRRPGQEGEGFEPEAFRDLLFIFGIAREIVEADAPLLGGLPDFDLPDAESHSRSAAERLVALAAVEDALPVIDAPLLTPSLSAPALDIDLSLFDGGAAPDHELAPVSGGNLIDFEVLSLGSPARALRPPGGHTRRH